MVFLIQRPRDHVSVFLQETVCSTEMGQGQLEHPLLLAAVWLLLGAAAKERLSCTGAHVCHPARKL